MRNHLFIQQRFVLLKKDGKFANGRRWSSNNGRTSRHEGDGTQKYAESITVKS